MYTMFVGHYGMLESEYWKTTIRGLELFHEARRSKMIGNIHENDYVRMEERRDELEAQGIKVL